MCNPCVCLIDHRPTCMYSPCVCMVTNIVVNEMIVEVWGCVWQYEGADADVDEDVDAQVENKNRTK